MEQRFLNMLVFIIIISSFTYLTYERNKVWRNDVTLWKDVTEKAPDNARAYNNLGRAYGAQGRDLEATEEFKKSIKILPNYALAHMNLAVSFSKLDMVSGAEFHFKEALRFYPELSETYYNYGYFLYSKKRYREAYQFLNGYIRLSPTGIFIPFTYKLLSDIKKRGYEK